MNPYDNPTEETNEPYELFDLDTPDDQLQKMLVDSLQDNIDHWNQDPFNLEDIDKKNIDYLLGNQLDEKLIQAKHGTVYIDNRLLTATRAVLAYVNARVATPEVSPSGGDERVVKLSEDLQDSLHQHSKDILINQKAKMATRNLVTRKRGFLKLRFDPDSGPYGDIQAESIDPSDIIIGRTAKYMEDPDVIYHRLRCTVEELIAKFPEKKEKILAVLGIKRGTFKQMTRMVTYYESWFTYWDDNKRRQGLAWFMREGGLVLGKMRNPNWIYTGDDQKDRELNFTPEPIKPFVQFNYLNTGKSYIDETCLLDQARPQQDLLNKRGRQIWENADHANGRVIANKNIMSEQDAASFLNKNPKTIMLVDSEDLGRDVLVVQPVVLPNYVYNTLIDARNEIDQIMGTPNIFRGQQQDDADTLGENILIKEQAGALQDDLAASVDEAMGKYYRYLLQMMKVYYTEDHWFHIKGNDGLFDSIMLNSDNIDTNVKVSVQAGSTLPANKAERQSVIMRLAEINKIADVDLFKALELPDAEGMAERLIKQNHDPLAYIQDIEKELFNREANIDITMLVEGKEPEERDEYAQGYLEYFNKFIMSNRFAKLAQDAKQRIVEYLKEITLRVARATMLGETQVDDAAVTGQTEADVADQGTMV